MDHFERMSDALHAYSTRLSTLLRHIDSLFERRPTVNSPDSWWERRVQLEKSIELGTRKFINAVKQRRPTDEILEAYLLLAQALDAFIAEATSCLEQMEATPWLN